MRCRRLAFAVTLIGICLVGGCGSSTGPKAAVSPMSTSAGPGGTPDELVGMWRVVAAGEPADTVLRVSADDSYDLVVFRDCGEFFGGWRGSTSGTFVAETDGFSNACMKTVRGNQGTPDWLARARAFRVRGVERDLIAADGTVAARLLPGGHPRPVTDLISTMQSPPTLDAATIQKLRAAPRPLPPDATPATAKTIVGTWKPDPSHSSATGKAPFAEFSLDGSWRTYDGCNGGGGRWALGSDGDFLATTGATAGVGCAGPVTDVPVDKARRAAVSGDVLSLYAADGRLVARLTR
jgi:hypothetical protein